MGSPYRLVIIRLYLIFRIRNWFIFRYILGICYSLDVGRWRNSCTYRYDIVYKLIPTYKPLDWDGYSWEGLASSWLLWTFSYRLGSRGTDPTWRDKLPTWQFWFEGHPLLTSASLGGRRRIDGRRKRIKRREREKQEMESCLTSSWIGNRSTYIPMFICTLIIYQLNKNYFDVIVKRWYSWYKQSKQ